MKNKIIFSIIILTILSVSTVDSFMPPSHRYLVEKTINDYPTDTNLYRVASKYPDLVYAGNILSDISVVYYYTQRNLYVATHQPIFFQSALQLASNDEELACSVGIGLHQEQDVRSHNDMVTYAIKHTGLANSVIHTFAEQHLDNIIQQRSPGIRDRALNVSDWERCKPLFRKVLQGNSEWKGLVDSGTFDQVYDKFVKEVSGSVTSYDVAFKRLSFFDNLRVIPTVILAGYVLSLLLWILLFFLILFRKGKTKLNYLSLVFLFVIIFFQAWLFIANLSGNAFVTFVKFISPISNFVPIGDPDSHINQALENGKELFTEGEASLINTDASGFASLDVADKSVMLTDYAVLIVILLLLFLFIRSNFKRKDVGSVIKI